MSLRGTLETFALADVLNLVAGTGKTGELLVVGEGTDGRIWLDGGQVVGARAGEVTDPAVAVFQLLRLETGEFTFEGDVAPPAPEAPQTVADVLAAAEARLAEWREIEKVVPSMQAYVRLEQAGPAAGVTLTPDQWAAVVAIGDGRPVEDVMDRLDEDELVVGRLVKTLVEAGLTSVGLAPAPARAAAPASTVEPAADAAPSPAVPTTATAADLVRQLATLNEATYRSQAAAPAAAEDDTHDEDDAQDGAEEGAEAPGDEPGPPPASGLADESVNRGMLLKFLSSVRS